MDIGTLTIERAMIHEVEQRIAGSESAVVKLSEAEARLHQRERSFIAERLKRAMRAYAVPVVGGQSAGSGAEIVSRYFRGDLTLVEVSHALAKLLASTQYSVSPPGLLLVSDVQDHTGTNGLAVAKLEHDTGIQAVAERDESGRSRYSVTVLDDLLLADTGKVFKVAIFPRTLRIPLNGEVVDRQSSGRGIANFFLSAFLGCELVEKPDVLTERFFKATESFIDTVEDTESAAQIQVGLLSEMQSNDRFVDPREFTRRYLPSGLQDEFGAWLTERSVRQRSFAKDTARITSHISRVRFYSASGVTVLAPPETIADDDHPQLPVRVEYGEKSAIHVVDTSIRVSGGSSRG